MTCTGHLHVGEMWGVKMGQMTDEYEANRFIILNYSKNAVAHQAIF